MPAATATATAAAAAGAATAAGTATKAAKVVKTAATTVAAVTGKAVPWDQVTEPSPWNLPRLPPALEAVVLGVLIVVIAIVVIAPYFQLWSDAAVRVWGQVFTGYLPPIPKNSLKGRTCVVTGANIGVGKATVEHLLQAGATRVIMACRSQQRAETARQDILASLPADVTKDSELIIVTLDLADLSSVDAFPQHLERLGIDTIDVLINNAGIMLIPGHTQDGHEMHVGTNHLGHFHLVKVLYPFLQASVQPRVIVLASVMHHAACLQYNNVEKANHLTCNMALSMGYNVSKLCNVLFAREFAHRLRDISSHIEVFIADPGTVHTNITNNLGAVHQLWQKIGHLFVRSPREGAWTSAWLATSLEVQGHSGGYFVNCRPGQVSVAGCDDDLATRLWDLSEEWTGSRFDL